MVLGTWYFLLYVSSTSFISKHCFQITCVGESVNKLTRALSLFVPFLMLLGATAWAGETLWTYRSASDLKWHRLLQTGELLAGGDAGIVCLNAKSGEISWKRDDLQGITAYQVNEVETTPYLLVAKNDSGKTRLWALDIFTGKTVWETEKLKGQTIGVYPHPTDDAVLLMTGNGSGKVRADMIYLRMSDGNVLWEAEFPDKIDLHQANQKSRWTKHFDLSGHQPPVFQGDAIFFTFAGLHRFDPATGKLVWAVPYDVTEGRLKRGNAQAVIEGDTVYTSSKGQLRAIDKNSGKVKWTSPDFGAAVAEMNIQGDAIYGRMGGTFFDEKKMEWELKKPLGVVAINKSTGAQLWKFDKMKDAITNMLFLPSKNMLLVADKEELVGLNTANGAVAFNSKVEFIHKTSAAQKTMKVARFGMGGLRGGLKGMSEDKKREDVPVTITLMENGKAIVRGRQNVVGFLPDSGQVAFANYYEAPGFGGWQQFAMMALNAASYYMNTAGAANTRLGTSSNTMYNENRQKDLSRMSDVLSKRFSATTTAGKYVYVLTQVEDGKDKGAGLVAVNLETGETEGSALIKDKEPDYVVDVISGNIFNLKDKEITAYVVR